jgi:hypothetical protein
LTREREQINEDLHVTRKRLNDLHNRTKKAIDVLEGKVLTYISNSKNIPSVETASILVGSLSSLYKMNMDSNTILLKSYEKEIDVQNRFNPPTDANDEMTAEDVAELTRIISMKEWQHKEDE